jgi:hypothetical protein
MEDQTTIKLKIPRQDMAGIPLFAPNVIAAENWVQNHPVTNTNSMVQLLGQALSELNRTAISPEARFNIIEILRPNLDVALSNLGKRYLNQPLIMPAEPARMAEQSDRLLTLTTTAYMIVAIEAIKQRDSIRETNPARLTCQAIHHALLYSGRKVLQNLQLHRPMEIHGWQTLHQLYALAEKQRLADLPVPEPLAGGRTIKATYLQAMMLGCCKPNQLRQSDLAALYRGLQEWSDLIKLDHKGTGDDLFLVDLDSDQPPLYSILYQARSAAFCRFIDTTDLLTFLEALKRDTADTGLRLDKTTVLPANVLDHLMSALDSMSLRNFKRTAIEGTLWICVGLSSTHYHVAGGRLFEQLLYGDAGSPDDADIVPGNPFLTSRGKIDVWQKANPGQDYSSDVKFDPNQPIDIDDSTMAKMLRDDDADLPPNQRYPIFKLQMADASPGGYCLEWDTELPSDIRVGDIVGLKEQAQSGWVIAVIRWLSRVDNAKTLIGLELLSPRAIAYGARIHQKGAEKKPPMRALLLPEIKLVGQPQTLITPRTGFKERQKVTIGHKSEAHSIQLLRHIASTASYAQFEFRYVKELGDVLAEGQQGRTGADYDSLWSNI